MSPETLQTDQSVAVGRGPGLRAPSVSEGARAGPQPPVCNTGVYPPSLTREECASIGHRFDYYRATVPAHYQAVISLLIDGLAAVGVEVSPQEAKGRFNFLSNTLLVDDLGAATVEVLHGGSNPHPCVEVSGVWSPIVSDILRSTPHRPSRVDACCDVAGDGLFPFLVEMTKGFAKDWRIRRTVVADDDPDQGDTIYLGSRKSQIFVRIYQPGLKRASEDGRTGDAITWAERNTVRLEVEFKPAKRLAKETAARLAAADVWGVSPWTTDLIRRVLDLEVQPVTVSERRESNRDRALRFMASQYRAHLESLLKDCQGDLGEFGALIAELADIGSEAVSERF